MLILDISLLVSSIIAIPTLFNFQTLFSIGYYSNQKVYPFSYTDGDGQLNVDTLIEYQDGNVHILFFTYSIDSRGEIIIQGINHLEYKIRVNGLIYYNTTRDWNPPQISFSSYQSLNLKKDDIVFLEGNVQIELQSQGTDYTEDIDYIINTIIPLNSYDVNQINLIIPWLITFNFIFLMVLCYFLLRILQRSKQEMHYEKVYKKKDEAYFEYLKKRKEEQQNT